MKKVILDLEENPPIKCLQFYAYPLGIMLTKPEGYCWLYNNFIQVYCCPKNGLGSFRFRETNFCKNIAFNNERLNENFYTKFNIDLLEYIKFGLEMKRWVYITSDEFYNKERKCYHQIHLRHDLLIYGYDEAIKSFMVIGYDAKNQYKKTLFAYGDLLLSEPKEICILSINERYISKLKPDLPKINLQLLQYLNLIEETQAGDVLYDEPLFGQEAFKYLADSINETIRNNENCDMRFTLMFYEHKKCMLMRMKYLQTIIKENITNIIESYQNVVNMAEKIHYCTLKYNVSNNKDINLRIQNYFSNALLLEKECLFDLIGILRTKYL
jgi:hypothetical protein